MEQEIANMYVKAHAFNLDRVALHCAVENDKDFETVRDWIPELKKWLIMLAHTESNELSVFGPVDELWHTFLSFTNEYEEFCQTVAGKFIHHVPAELILESDGGIPLEETGLFETPSRIREVRLSQIEKYKNSLETYKQLFSPPTNDGVRETLSGQGIEIYPTEPDHPDYDPDLDPLILVWPQVPEAGKVTCHVDSCGGGGCGCIQTGP